MTLKSLIDVIDGDTVIIVQYQYEHIFNGFPDEFTILEHNEKVVKGIWYSKLNSALMIEI